jgi:S1-C subfamily serine protease
MDDEGETGVVVTKVERRSTAARLGLRPGDIIVGVNDEEIQSVKHLSELLQAAVGRWRLAIERGGKVFDLTVRG